MIPYAIDNQGLLPFIETGAFETYKARAERSLSRWYDVFQEETLPLFTLPTSTQDLIPLLPLTEYFQDEFTDVVILGTGGSSLGAQTLCAVGPAPGLQMHFLENIDPETISNLLKTLSPATTGIIVISKSGETIETLMQFSLFLQKWEKKEGRVALKDHFLAITGPQHSTIRTLAEANDIPILDHPSIGGRFSALSVVGLLPAMIYGLNANRIRKGASDVLNHFFGPQPVEKKLPLMGAIYAAMLAPNYPSAVMMPYLDRMKLLSKWWRQLWAESLGKQGHGSLPVDALGTVDQHSQVQFYLDGPKKTSYTLLYQNTFADDLDSFWEHAAAPATFKDISLGKLLNASCFGTWTALQNQKCPVRLIQVQCYDEETIGALMMHFMLETIITADLFEIDAFDQPAVEEGKKLILGFLRGEGAHDHHSPSFTPHR